MKDISLIDFTYYDDKHYRDELAKELFQYPINDYLDNLVYDYLENVVGYNNLLDLIARMNLCGVDYDFNPFSVYHELNSIVLDTDEISEETGIYKIMGVFKYDGSCVTFDYNVEVSYKFVDNYIKCSHLSNNKVNDSKYYLESNYINVDVDCDLSQFKYVYYLLIGTLNYGIDFGGHGVYILDPSFHSKLSYLIEHHDELMNYLFETKGLTNLMVDSDEEITSPSELLKRCCYLRIRVYKLLYSLNAKVLNKCLSFSFYMNDFESDIDFVESGKTLGEEYLILPLKMHHLNTLYFRYNPKALEYCELYHKAQVVPDSRLIKHLPQFNFKRDNLILYIEDMDRDLTDLLKKQHSELSKKYKHLLVAYK